MQLPCGRKARIEVYTFCERQPVHSLTDHFGALSIAEQEGRLAVPIQDGHALDPPRCRQNDVDDLTLTECKPVQQPIITSPVCVAEHQVGVESPFKFKKAAG